MNIHINKEEFDWLMNQNRLGRFVMGSKLYGLNDEYSDEDVLIITWPYEDVLSSPFNSHHQFQYKDVENNIDYNFVDIITFIKNLVTGDSTVNFELLHSEQMEENINLNWLTKYKDKFRSYNIIKAYLGLAERDIRHFNKKHGRDKLSAQVHIDRGYYFACDILSNNFKLKNHPALIISKRDTEKNAIQYERNLSKFKETIKNYRQNILNPAFEKKQIPRFLDIETQHKINTKLTDLLFNKDVSYLKTSLLDKIFYYNENTEFKYD